MKIKIQLSILVIGIMVTVIAIISFITLQRASRMQKNAVMSGLNYMSGMYATDIQRRFEGYLKTATNLSQIMKGYDDAPVDQRRIRYNGMMLSIIEENDDYLGAFTVWDVDALDGKDAEYANTPGTDATGRFISWYHRELDGVKLEPYNMYKEVWANAKRHSTIASPVWREALGRKVLVVDVSAPVISQEGKLVGIVGINIDIAGMQDIVDKIKPFDTGIATVYSNDGS
ncbi:MAG: hypothetical protein LBG42_04290 [Treponema sp.]|jgi:methyl-accepting chemotaxis protein|nr:hypothetical protein [Treponema sp.]